LLFAGLLLVVPGIASLVVPIPQTETEGIPVGNTTFGVQTSHRERVSPLIRVVLIAGGIALSIAGARARNGRAFLSGTFSKPQPYATRRPLTRLMTSTTSATTSSK
jgi:hypothetical protein